MAAPRFVHLRLHTEYSIVDGMARVDDAVAAAAADGMPALAITDQSNLFGAIKFFEAARARAGYLALCDILTRAHAENHWRGRAEVRREWLRGRDGLIALSGGQYGD